jgi:hypothetical protein
MIDPVSLLVIGYVGAVAAKFWGISKMKTQKPPVNTVARPNPIVPPPPSNSVDPTPDYFLAGLDEVLCTPNECAQIPRRAGVWAAQARMALHIVDDDLATRMMVKDWLRAEMEKLNYRKGVIATLIPFAVQFAFLPTRTEIDAREQTMSDGYRARYRKRARLWKFSPGWDEWLSFPYLFKEEIVASRN